MTLSLMNLSKALLDLRSSLARDAADAHQHLETMQTAVAARYADAIARVDALVGLSPEAQAELKVTHIAAGGGPAPDEPKIPFFRKKRPIPIAPPASESYPAPEKSEKTA